MSLSTRLVGTVSAGSLTGMRLMEAMLCPHVRYNVEMSSSVHVVSTHDFRFRRSVNKWSGACKIESSAELILFTRLVEQSDGCSREQESEADGIRNGSPWSGPDVALGGFIKANWRISGVTANQGIGKKT